MKKFLHFESKDQPLLGRAAFARRVWRSLLVASLLVSFSLFAGMLGYHQLENLPWIDSFLSAAMILSGMGPVATMTSWSGKLFAGLYALYSGLALIVISGIILAPMVHRVLHRFHLDDDDQGNEDRGK